jgi:hemoglobin
MKRAALATHAFTLSVLLACGAMIASSGCRSTGQKKDQTFFTSGSKEADQRASQRMAKSEQLSGSGEGAGEKNGKSKPDSGTNTIGQAKEKTALFTRLGGEAGISNIVSDFMPRLLQDPRVNWERKGVKRGGFSFHSGDSVTWNATPENVALLSRHLVEFLELATGGPVRYDGKEIQSAHANLHISNPEFDAAVGDIKASLDKLKVPNAEQKELLAIVESTRPQIVQER